MRLVTASEMRAVEATASSLGVSPERLLEQAGAAIADRLAVLHGRGRHGLVLVGKGNNGGDALVAARHLSVRHGWRLLVAIVAERPAGNHLADLRTACAEGEVDVVVAGSGAPRGWEERVDTALAEVDVVIDGLLGIGARGNPRGDVAGLLARCAASPPGRRQARVAIDVPSGVDADRGTAGEDAFQATRTLATGPAKPGTFVGAGGALAGRVDVLDIGLPRGAWPGTGASTPCDDGGTYRVAAREASFLFPPRPDRSHKGTFGRVAIVGGCARYPGAPVLAALGAIHGGAGLVAVARPRVATAVPLPAEAIAIELPDGSGDHFDSAHVGAILGGAATIRAVVLGPGLGTAPETVEAVRNLVARLAREAPIVVDADGLNALAGTMDRDGTRGGTWVVTPHAAEMARLTGLEIRDVVEDPLTVARATALRWGAVVVLKGAPTVVASPRGTTMIGAYSNAALATAGSGDVLSGLIASFLAQGASPWASAVAGVTVHAVAAEAWRRDHGNAGMRASDLAARLPVARTLVARFG